MFSSGAEIQTHLRTTWTVPTISTGWANIAVQQDSNSDLALGCSVAMSVDEHAAAAHDGLRLRRMRARA